VSAPGSLLFGYSARASKRARRSDDPDEDDDDEEELDELAEEPDEEEDEQPEETDDDEDEETAAMPTKTGNEERVLAMVTAHVKKHGRPPTTPEIASATDLATGTVSSIYFHLRTKGLVPDRRGGRPATAKPKAEKPTRAKRDPKPAKARKSAGGGHNSAELPSAQLRAKREELVEQIGKIDSAIVILESVGC
jgi:hypothetical protein